MERDDHTDGRSVPGAVYIVLAQNWTVLAVACAFSVSLTALSADAGDGDDWVLFTIPFELLVWVIVFSVTFSYLLYGVTGLGAIRLAATLRVYWRDFILRLLMLVFAVVLVGIFGALSEETFGNVFVSYLVVWVLLFLVYGLVGTWLVGAATGEGRQLSAAFRRGNKSFPQTYGQLLMFAGPPIVVSSALFSYAMERSWI